jgi:hypothetical protein
MLSMPADKIVALNLEIATIWNITARKFRLMQ